jgi:hypothetical protein
MPPSNRKLTLRELSLHLARARGMRAPGVELEIAEEWLDCEPLIIRSGDVNQITLDESIEYPQYAATERNPMVQRSHLIWPVDDAPTLAQFLRQAPVAPGNPATSASSKYTRNAAEVNHGTIWQAVSRCRPGSEAVQGSGEK